MGAGLSAFTEEGVEEREVFGVESLSWVTDFCTGLGGEVCVRRRGEGAALGWAGLVDVLFNAVGALALGTGTWSYVSTREGGMYLSSHLR